MKKFLLIFVASAAVFSACCKSVPASVPAHIENGQIVLEQPARPEGQSNVLGLKCDPIDTVRIAFVGIGGRGTAAVQRYTHLEGVKIVAFADVNPDRMPICQKILSDAGLPNADEYLGEEAYRELCARKDIDLVYVVTDWNHHFPVTMCAMENNHHVAFEVPGVMSIDECWKIVDMAEKKRLHCMLIENCCYDFFEMSTLQMAQKGLFGNVYHVEGAYLHFLSDNWDHSEVWRLDYNMAHRGDNYASHGFGPICQVMNIHRGDKLDYIVSMDTPSYNGKAAALKWRGVEECQDGDHTISLIQTAKRGLMEIQHNVYCPRPYSRMHQLTGDKGYASKYPINVMSIKDMNGHEALPLSQMDSLIDAYRPAWVNEIMDKAKAVGGHGGMDFIMDYRIIYCLHHGLPMDMDVYDAAEWSAVQELSRISLENGSMPVKYPDFTRGDWNLVKGFDYAL